MRNSIEYFLKYGDSKYKELTAEYDKKMDLYEGPKYHLKDEEFTDFPIFNVLDERNKSLQHFYDCNIDKIVISNYDRDKYDMFLPTTNDTSNMKDDMDTSVGFLQVDHTIPDSQHTCTTGSENNNDRILADDGYRYLHPIFKEVVDAVGTDQDLFLFSKKQ